MKKLKLNVDDLSVTSFAAQGDKAGTGTVNAMDSYHFTCRMDGCPRSYFATECVCTHDVDCYPSLYCSQGQYEHTCAGCMTNAAGDC